MKQFISALAMLGLMASSVMASGFDEPTNWDSVSDGDLRVTPYFGKFSGGDIVRGVADSGGELNKVATDDGYTAGLRFGKESTWWGCEVSAGGVFADENVSNGVDGTTSGNASWYLLNADLLLFPVGDKFADGVIRPYIGAGPGMAYYNADTDLIDSKALLDMNVAAGTAITLSESLPQLRIDYRWHFIDGGSSYIDHCYREFTVGLCFEF